jgi:hypothetical protein
MDHACDAISMFLKRHSFLYIALCDGTLHSLRRVFDEVLT